MDRLDRLAADLGLYDTAIQREQWSKDSLPSKKTTEHTSIPLQNLLVPDSIIYFAGYVFIILCIGFTLYHFVKNIRNKKKIYARLSKVGHGGCTMNRWFYLGLCLLLGVLYTPVYVIQKEHIPIVVGGYIVPYWLIREIYYVILALITIPRLKKVGESPKKAFFMLIPYANLLYVVKLIFKKDYRKPLFEVPSRFGKVSFPPPPPPEGLNPPETCSWCGVEFYKLGKPPLYMGNDKSGHPIWFCARCVKRIITNEVMK